MMMKKSVEEMHREQPNPKQNRTQQIPNEKYKVFGAMVRVLGFRFSRAALAQRQCILSINA